MEIFIKKDILHDETIDNYTIGAYIALRSFYNIYKDNYYVSDNMLCYELSGSTSFSRNMKEAVHEGIRALAQRGYIEVQGKISKSEGIINLEGLFFDTYKEPFVILKSEEIHKIFSLKGNIDKFALLRYYACVIDSINGNDFIRTDDFEEGILKNFVGNQAIKSLAKRTGIPEKTGIAYNNLLEELEIIYIYRHEKYNLDGDIKSLTNHYGRKCHEKYIKMFALDYEDKTGQSQKVVKAKEDANARRSLTQRYNAFIDGADYTQDEVVDLYMHILKHNDKYQKMIDGSLDEEVIKKAKKQLKDISKFEEYFGLAV